MRSTTRGARTDLGQQSGWAAWRVVRSLILAASFAFIAAPLLVIIYQAVNSAPVFPAAFEGFTLDWFSELFARAQFTSALVVSLEVGAASVMIALLLGVPAGLAIARGPNALRSSIVGAGVVAPIVIPQIVIGLAILEFASRVNLEAGLWLLIGAHAVVLLPYVIRSVAAAATTASREPEQVAMTLGADPKVVFRTVTLPILRPSIVASALFAFILSFVNVPLSLFLSSPQDRPLPIEAFNYMTSRIDPVIAALATAVLVIVAFVAIFIDRVLRVRLFE